MSELPPDEELPRKLDAIERSLATNQHRWSGRATLLAALATGLPLLLPWTFSRRLGLSVWQLGVETQPALALTWLAGLATSIAALALHPGARAQVAAAVTGVIAVIFVTGAWQATSVASLSDTWPGPGRAIAIITGLAWLLAAATHLLTAAAPSATPPAPADLSAAIARLRRHR
ncbi:hypothetical protein GCM10009789_58360 [Kribbella sancticallisti]|uniref:Tryptophan-associated transmembrane protein (Trp_oprn_chp) n=1 Tax=Kribbella sancticallisti TaxID=460087 RepID=A0ABP4Q111_9ACTN